MCITLKMQILHSKLYFIMLKSCGGLAALYSWQQGRLPFYPAIMNTAPGVQLISDALRVHCNCVGVGYLGWVYWRVNWKIAWEQEGMLVVKWSVAVCYQMGTGETAWPNTWKETVKLPSSSTTPSMISRKSPPRFRFIWLHQCDPLSPEGSWVHLITFELLAR